MQFSTILIATAALAMTVIAAPIAGDEGHGSHTEIHDSGNIGDVSQSGNQNYCSNQADRTTQACCNKSNKSGGGGLLGLEILSNAEILSLQCVAGKNCQVDQKAYCCKLENNSHGFNLAQISSCGPLIDVL